LQQELSALGLRFVPSVANFVLVNVGDGPKIFRALLERRIIVRALKGYNLAAWIRISIGTMEQNRRCIAALKEILTQTAA
jgi:histidinol-phosphate aminotransferase